jgi:hypothetical protein
MVDTKQLFKRLSFIKKSSSSSTTTTTTSTTDLHHQHPHVYHPIVGTHYSTLTKQPQVIERIDRRISLNRYDMFSPLHKAIRSIVFRTVQHSGKINYEDTAEVTKLITEINTMVIVFKSYSENEHKYLYLNPKIDKQEQIVELRNQQVYFNDVYMKAIRECINQLELSITMNDIDQVVIRANTGRKLSFLLIEFMCEYFYHLKRQLDAEDEMDHFISDEEKRDIEREIIINMDVSVRNLVLYHMLLAMNFEERVRVNGVLQSHKESYDLYCNLARDILVPSEYEHLLRLLQYK